MAEPMSQRGNPLRLLGTGEDDYAVLLDTEGQECSERLPGRLWLEFDPQRVGHVNMTLLFVPEATGAEFTTSTILPTRKGVMVGVGLFLGGTHVYTLPIGNGGWMVLEPGWQVQMHWGESLNDLMA